MTFRRISWHRTSARGPLLCLIVTLAALLVAPLAAGAALPVTETTSSTSAADTEAPKVVSVVVSEDRVNVAHHVRELVWTVGVSDASEVVSVTADILSPDGPSGASGVALTKESEDRFVVRWKLGTSSALGDWKLMITETRDVVGNVDADPEMPAGARTTVTAYHGPDVPGPPQQTSATPTARGSLTVGWTTPATDGESPITGYSVTLLPERRSVVLGPDARSHTFTGLGDDEEHTFEVSAANALGTGQPQVYYWPVRTWGVPDAPQFGTVTANRTTVDLTWSWNRSENPIDEFIVTAHPSGRTLNVPAPWGSRTATAVFTGLEAGVGHTFTVAARNVVGLSQGSLPSGTVLLVPQPQAPTLAGEVRSGGDVFVYWGKPLGYDTIDVYEACQHRGDGAIVRCQLTRYGDTTFTEVRSGRVYGYTVRARGELGYGPRSAVVQLTSPAGAGDGYTPVSPRRVLDTRYGTGFAKRQVGPRETMTLHIPTLPPGTRSVVMNLTATGTTAATYLSVHAAGTARPVTSNLNATPGETVASLVTVPVSADGRVSIYNNAGRVHLIADLAGYGTPSGGSVLKARAGERLIDTRSSTSATRGKVGPGETFYFGPGRSEGAGGPTAAIVNITATGATAATHLTAYPADSVKPTASNVNVAAGGTVANLAVVRLDKNGYAKLTNSSGYAHVIIDLVGVYTVDTGVGFAPAVPTRAMDTRFGLGASGPIGTAPVSLSLTGVPVGAKAVLLRATAVSPTRSGNLLAHPSTSLTSSSTLNFVAGQTVGNTTVVPIGPDRVVRFSASSGVQTHLVVDVAGYYVR